MAELLLLSLPRAAAVAADRAARKGDPDAVSWLESLFEPYRDWRYGCMMLPDPFRAKLGCGNSCAGLTVRTAGVPPAAYHCPVCESR